MEILKQENASNGVLHGDEEFDGALDLGRDSTGGRHFKGWLDDVRIYRAALTPRDIEQLYRSATAVGAGEVPDGADLPGLPLSIEKLLGRNLRLTWDLSCLASDVDYAVYEGAIGDYTSHTPVACGTAGASSVSVRTTSGLFVK